MNSLDVKIVTLPPLKAASFYGFGQTPETIAHENANQWMEELELKKSRNFRHFGFNNPNPSEGSPNYGYEIWIVPEDGLPSNSEAKAVEFEGGLYAVALCPSLEVIGQTWQQLVAWRDASEYTRGSHQWLEELIDPWDMPENEMDFRFYLYLPIQK